MLYNPLEQFEVVIYLNFSLFFLDFSLTNSGFYMLIILFVATGLFFFSLYFSYVISNS